MRLSSLSSRPARNRRKTLHSARSSRLVSVIGFPVRASREDLIEGNEKTPPTVVELTALGSLFNKKVVDACSVGEFVNVDSQTHLLLNRAAQEAAHRVSLPAG